MLARVPVVLFPSRFVPSFRSQFLLLSCVQRVICVYESTGRWVRINWILGTNEQKGGYELTGYESTWVRNDWFLFPLSLVKLLLYRTINFTLTALFCLAGWSCFKVAMPIMSRQEIYIIEDVWWPHSFQEASEKETKERYLWNLVLPGLWSKVKLTEGMGWWQSTCK